MVKLFEIWEGYTIVKVQMDLNERKEGGIAIASKGVSDPWSDATKLSCENLSWVGICEFLKFAEKIIGVKLQTEIEKNL